MLWAFYGRVSSVEQTHNNSLPTQQEACRTRAMERGASEVLDFVDAGVPGDLDWTDRPALSRLLDLAEKGGLGGVIVYDPDRLARDLGVQLAVTEFLTKHGVRLEFITQDFNASPEGMLFYQIRGAVAQFERAKIRERTSRGRKKLLRSGRPANRVHTYGLVYDRPSNTWSIEPAKAGVVRQIFAWAAGGHGPGWIADRLNQGGVEPPGAPAGSRWWQGTVRRMLTNRAYIGQFFVHRYKYEGHRKNRFLPPERRVRVAERPRSDWVEIPVPPIVDLFVWNAVQAELLNSKRQWSGARSSYYEYLASRLIRCGLCGSRMQGATGNGRRSPTYYYRCWGRYGRPGNGCSMPHLRASELDAALWSELRGRLTGPEWFGRIAARLCEAAAMPGAVAPQDIEARLAEIREDIDRLIRLIDQGTVKETDVRSALRRLGEQERSLSARRRTWAKRAARPEMISAEMVDRLTPSERKAHARRILIEVHAFPDGRLELVPKDPPCLDPNRTSTGFATDPGPSGRWRGSCGPAGRSP